MDPHGFVDCGRRIVLVGLYSRSSVVAFSTLHNIAYSPLEHPLPGILGRQFPVVENRKTTGATDFIPLEPFPVSSGRTLCVESPVDRTDG